MAAPGPHTVLPSCQQRESALPWAVAMTLYPKCTAPRSRAEPSEGEQRNLTSFQPFSGILLPSLQK